MKGGRFETGAHSVEMQVSPGTPSGNPVPCDGPEPHDVCRLFLRAGTSLLPFLVIERENPRCFSTTKIGFFTNPENLELQLGKREIV
jgi:hypothetical protein